MIRTDTNLNMHVNNTLISNIRSFSAEIDVSAQIQTIVHQSLGYKAANGPIGLAKIINNLDCNTHLGEKIFFLWKCSNI